MAVCFMSDPEMITPSLGVTACLLSWVEVHVKLGLVRLASFVWMSNAFFMSVSSKHHISLNVL